MRHLMLGLGLLVGGTCHAGDFLDDPKALCDWFQQRGMAPSVPWDETAESAMPSCMYVEMFGDTVTTVRMGGAFIDTNAGTVGLSLVVMAPNEAVSRDEALEALSTFLGSFHDDYAWTMPDGAADLMRSEQADSLEAQGMTFTTSDLESWKSQRMVTVTWSRAMADKADSSVETGSDGDATASGDVGDDRQQVLANRCESAIRESGHLGVPADLKGEPIMRTDDQLMMRYGGTGGAYFCQVCDAEMDGATCGNLGLSLNYRPDEGDAIPLPAELQRKCVEQALIHAGGTPGQLDRALLARIETSDAAMGDQVVYLHQVDGKIFNCSVDRNTMAFTFEVQDEQGEWRAVSAGSLH